MKYRRYFWVKFWIDLVSTLATILVLMSIIGICLVR